MEMVGQEPLLISQPHGRKLLDVGTTKWHELTKKGIIEIVYLDGRPMAVYASLKRLAQPKQAA